MVLNLVQKSRDALVGASRKGTIGVRTESRDSRVVLTVGELSAGFCHNFNNILVSVLGPAQLLKQYTDQPQVLREAEVIIAGVRLASDLVHRLYQAVRDESEGPLGAVSLNEGIRQILQRTRYRWKDESDTRGIPVEIVTELEEVPPIQGILVELDHVVVILLFNALEAMPEGGTITFRTQRQADRVLFTVTDTGRGMEEGVRRRVFEPFFTTKMDVSSGLGLFAAYRIVTRWGGEIEVASAPGKGTTFALRFPVWVEPVLDKGET